MWPAQAGAGEGTGKADTGKAPQQSTEKDCSKPKESVSHNGWTPAAVKKLLEDVGATQLQVASEMGVAPIALSSWLRGKVCVPQR